MSEFSEELKRLLDAERMDVSARQLEQMEIYYCRLVETNRQYNLTRVTEPAEAAKKHFFDSVVPAALIAQGARVADVGSGAGFPAAPLAILRPDLHLCAVESSAKKCAFIEQAAAAAGIGIEVICARAEELKQRRESFDVCVSRAVAELRILCELCSPLIKPFGYFFAYKNESGSELSAARTALAEMKLELAQKVRSAAEDGRSVLVYRKTGMLAAKYPRRYAQIVKNFL